MHIADLEKFLIIADTENLQRAGEQLHTSASVLSKSLKRLELNLGVSLFDRVGKHLQLNASGQALRANAAALVAQAQETHALFSSSASDRHYRISGPSILLCKWASVISRFLLRRTAQARVQFDCYYEQEALERVRYGLADLALVTTAIKPLLPQDVYVKKIGEVKMQVAASANHVLLAGKQKNQTIGLSELLSHSFVTPSISPYCGKDRGVGCDGWNNNIYPRKLPIIVNDYSVLTQLVRSGQALAYLPDYWIREQGLIPLSLDENPGDSREQLLLVSRQQVLLDDFIHD